METKIEELRTFDSRTLESVNRLLGQLSSREIKLSAPYLEQLISDAGSHLFVLWKDGGVAGMMTIGTYSAPTGCKWWLEDVVVDAHSRGCGLGRLLVEHAISYVRVNGGGQLMLTSRPERVEANALYVAQGFELRRTNAYKMDVNP